MLNDDFYFSFVLLSEYVIKFLNKNYRLLFQVLINDILLIIRFTFISCLFYMLYLGGKFIFILFH